MTKGRDYAHTKLIFWYTHSKISEKNKQLLEQLIVDNLPTQDTEEIMRSIPDSYIDHDIDKRIAIREARSVEKEKRIIAQKMLESSTDIKFIFAVTGLSQDEITNYVISKYYLGLY